MTELRTIALGLLLPIAAAAQNASLRGRVLTDSTERPIAGVVVEIADLKVQATTDSLGNFVLPNIKPGAYIVSAKKIGFGALATRVRFAVRDALEADFLMTPNVQSLPDVNVETRRRLPPKLQEFEERRTSGSGGRFITQDDLDARAYSVTADVIRSKVPGMDIVRDAQRPSQAYVAGGRMAGGGIKPCFAAVVVDGVFVYQGILGERPFDINSLGPNIIGGMEFYAGAASMPVKYGGMRGSCGLVIVWTR